MGAAELLAKRARQVAAATQQDVPSPCVAVCRMDPVTELCLGCYRSLDEIALWGRMDERGKREIWQLIAQRLRKDEPT